MVNNVFLIGRITNDLQLKATQTGTNYVQFGLATSKKILHKESGNWQEVTTFHNVSCWGKQAENLVKYQKKGSLICVQGEIQNNNYKDKNGVEIKSFKIHADSIQYLSSGKTETEQHANTANESTDDIPF